MNRVALVAELKTLGRLIDERTTQLAPETMQVDVEEYLDAGTFERELQLIFRRYPCFVGFSSQFARPGDYCALHIGATPVIVMRNASGEMKGFLNFCRHRGSQLLQDGTGCLQKGIRCPYHSWSYDLDGALRTVPYGDKGFPHLSKAEHSLIPLQVAEKHGIVFVMPDPGRTFEIDEFLGDMGAELDSWSFAERHYVETRNYTVNVNWKLNLDTFGESYHFSTVHPETFAKKTYENISTLKEFPNGHRACHPALILNEMRQQPEEDWNLNFAMSVVYYIFPSTILFIVRGHMETFTLLPGRRPDESITRHQMYLLDSVAPSSEGDRKAIQELFDMVSHVLQNEDYPIVERMQRNFLGCRDQKVTFGRNEGGLHSMHKLLRREMARQLNGGSKLRSPGARDER